MGEDGVTDLATRQQRDELSHLLGCGECGDVFSGRLVGGVNPVLGLDRHEVRFPSYRYGSPCGP